MARRIPYLRWLEHVKHITAREGSGAEVTWVAWYKGAQGEMVRLCRDLACVECSVYRMTYFPEGMQLFFTKDALPGMTAQALPASGGSSK